MRISLSLASLMIVLLTTATVVSGQRLTCSCEFRNSKDSKDTCHPEIKSNDGCTAICGSHDACGSYGRQGFYEQRITRTFVKATGGQIVSVLSSLTHEKIEFEPYRQNKGAKYDVDMKDDDLFNVLNFLSKRGVVKINGTDFFEIKKLLNQKKYGTKQIPPV